MKIALISPKGPLYRHRGGIFVKSLRYQPLTLPVLASLVPEEFSSAPIDIYDDGVEDVPEGLTADLVGMTVITGNAKRAYALSDSFRGRGIPVVLGGPHVTLLPEEALEHADAICVGYAEDAWPELLRDFVSGGMKREYRQAEDFSLERLLPYPRRDLMSPKRYLTQAVFEASRSCVHDCEFCVAPTAWGQRQYRKNIGQLVNDIRNVGMRQILFVDLNLISDLEYAKELFQALVPLNVEWFGLSTLMIAHEPELMTLMAKSGCKGLLLGFEALSGDSLGDVHKNFNASVDYGRLVHDLHKLGIAVQGCFVFGLDHDDKDVFDKAANCAIEWGIDLPRFSILTPFPGTPLFKRLSSERRILTRDWELYDGQHVVFQPVRMTPDELLRGHERAWKKVYGWSGMARRLRRAGNYSLLKLSVNFGYRFYAHRLRRFYTCDVPLRPNQTPLRMPDDKGGQ
ncbi:B12-binding domain-containing radical SAM protein [Synergistales bacterium]|nr:B12-binding domain-containing radical SAM protein [Synergistales bacterium]